MKRLSDENRALLGMGSGETMMLIALDFAARMLRTDDAVELRKVICVTWDTLYRMGIVQDKPPPLFEHREDSEGAGISKKTTVTTDITSES